MESRATVPHQMPNFERRAGGNVDGRHTARHELPPTGAERDEEAQASPRYHDDVRWTTRNAAKAGAPIRTTPIHHCTAAITHPT